MRSQSSALRLVPTSLETHHSGFRGALVHSGLPHVPSLNFTAGKDQVPLLQSSEKKSALLWYSCPKCITCFPCEKTSHRPKRRDTSSLLFKSVKVMKDKRRWRLSQIKGDRGDMTTKCNVASWTGH